MMRLWWLSFTGGTAVILAAETLVHARLLAAMNELGRASRLVNGIPVDPEFEQMIPDDYIGRRLLRDEAKDLLSLLRRGPRSYGVKPSQHRAPVGP
jgi:hypothetical protein